MNFNQQEQTPAKRFTGLAVVVLLHALVLYALVSGLAKRVVDVVRAPIETKVIEEVVKAPPPPPEVVVPPPPKLEAPPPPFIPPPEVQIAAPAPVQPTITAGTPTPPAVVEVAPMPAPELAPAVPAPPPKPVIAAIGVACQKTVAPVMPARAVEEGINGAVKARITIRNSKVVAVDIVSAKPRGVFDAAVRAAMMKYSCQTEGDQVVVAEQDFQFKLEE